MKLNDLRIYQQAMDVADVVWSLVSQWDYFAKDTIGKQWVRSVDSIAANISEGFGRFHYKEHKQFLFYARGSLYESMTWLEKAKKRNLVTDENFDSLSQSLNSLAPQLNSYIKTIGNSPNGVKEEIADYGSTNQASFSNDK